VILTALPPAPTFDADFAPACVAARLPLRDMAELEIGEQIIDLADQIQRHEFPVLATVIDAGPDIRWRRDYLRGIETGLVYFRRIPYLDTARAGDHK
jgi:hypothetical protein